MGIASKSPEARPELMELNGRLGVLLWEGDVLASATILEPFGPKPLGAMYTIRNPEKLVRLARIRSQS